MSSKKAIAKVAEASQALTKSIHPCYFYVNSKQGELDHVKVKLSGKDVNLTGNNKSELDINKLDLPDITKQALIALCALNSPKAMLGYRNVYDFAIGMVPVDAKSYKCVIACHKSDSKQELIFNQNALFNVNRAIAVLTKHKVGFKPERKFARVGLSEEKLPKVIAAAKELLS